VSICTCRQSQVREGIHRRLFSASNLEALKNLTFDTFKPRGRVGLGQIQADTLERAYNHSKMFASSLNGWLLLKGTYGSGKTHLAAAIANQAVSLGVPTLFLTVPDLLDWMRFSYDSPQTSFEERFEEIRNIQLLILDDFGTQNSTGWAQEKLFQIVNHRYVNQLPLVVTTNMEMEQIDERIRSRLRDPELVTELKILATDFRNPAKEDTGHPELSSLDLHGQQTFGSFSLRSGQNIQPEDLRSLEKAFRAAQAFAEKPHGWLVLTGNYGCGKTHLAAAIGNYLASQGMPPLFVVVPDLLDHLRATFSPTSSTSYDRRFEEIKTTPLLILDDLGTQSTTPWAKEKLFQLFNYRYNAQVPTVITTSIKLEELDGRIQTRMLDKRLCDIYGITVPPFYETTQMTKSRRTSRRSI